jgi:transcriptional regulator with PAS, ATPase and Fis domain
MKPVKNPVTEFLKRCSKTDLEAAHIEAMLEKHNGNKCHAAWDMGISIRALRYKLDRYNLTEWKGHVR